MYILEDYAHVHTIHYPPHSPSHHLTLIHQGPYSSAARPKAAAPTRPGAAVFTAAKFSAFSLAAEAVWDEMILEVWHTASHSVPVEVSPLARALASLAADAVWEEMMREVWQTASHSVPVEVSPLARALASLAAEAVWEEMILEVRQTASQVVEEEESASESASPPAAWEAEVVMALISAEEAGLAELAEVTLEDSPVLAPAPLVSLPVAEGEALSEVAEALLLAGEEESLDCAAARAPRARRRE